jgi:tRNA A-37 threonylcarbamoyl transferase component Bud32
MPGFEGLLAGPPLGDRYRIEEVVGRGGFAAVYRATDERLGRPVAVKVITFSATNPEVRQEVQERFRREARAIASLHHPNVVTLYDFGTDPALELDFFVMELLRGEDLAHRLARPRPIPAAAALRILRDAAAGVNAGHEAGLVHRDIKPGNVFLARREPRARVRVCVLDFGIARFTLAEDATRLTRAGGMLLSPAYASPEQLRGAAAITPASDVFSLGVIGYELLTRDRPFPGNRLQPPAEGYAPPVPAHERNSEVPAAVSEVLARALAEDPAERFPDAGALAAALASVETEAPPAAPPLPPVVVTPAAPAAVPEPPPRAPQDAPTRRLDAPPHPVPPPSAPMFGRPGRKAGMAAAGLLGAAGVGLAAWLAAGGGDGPAGSDAPAATGPVARREAPAQPVPEPAESVSTGPASTPAPPSSAASGPSAAGAAASTGGERVPDRGAASPSRSAPAGAAPAAASPSPAASRASPPAADPPARTAARSAPPEPPARSTSPAARPAPAASGTGTAVPSPRRAVVGRAGASRLNREGEALFARNDLPAAVARFRAAVRAAPGNAYYRNNLGWALFRAGEVEEAGRELEETVRLDPRRDIAYANLGEVRAAQGDTAAAIALYERFLELNTSPRREQVAQGKLRRLRGS